MRVLMIAAAAFLAAPALAQTTVSPSDPWHYRINTCVALWNGATAAQRGTMTYRQFITKCVGGQTALPIETSALCRDGSVSHAAAREGACANNDGVAQWTQ